MEFFRPNLDRGVPVTELNPLQEACPPISPTRQLRGIEGEVWFGVGVPGERLQSVLIHHWVSTMQVHGGWP